MSNHASLREIAGMFACLGTGLPSPYCLDAGDLPLPLANGAMAWALRQGCDDHLQQLLIDQGEWRGPAPIIVFAFDAIRDDAERLGVPFDEFVRGVAVHELAHCRSWAPPAEEYAEPEPEAVESTAADYIDFAIRDPAPPEDQPLWAEDHGLMFTRVALHLHARAAAAGYAVAIGWLVAGDEYGLSPARCYAEALGDEPKRLAGAPLADIIRARAPVAFTNLFAKDIDLRSKAK